MTGMAVFIIFYIAAFLVGKWSDIIVTKLGSRPSITLRFAMGGCIMILIGIVSCFTGAIVSLSPGASVTVATAMIFACIAAAYVVAVKGGIKTADYFEGINRGEIILWLIFALITVFEITAVLMFQSDRIEAIRPVSVATAIFDGGHISISDPMMLLIGCIGSVTGIHPLTVIFMLIPAPLISLYSICCVAAVNTVCRRYGAIASIFTALLGIWGYQSEALIPVTLLLSWYSTKVFIVYGVMSIAAVLLILYLRGRPEEKTTGKDEENDEEYLEEWDMNKHKIINARNLAIAVGILVIAVISAVFVLNNKINRLYDATVNLQSDMNSRCSVYEFVPDSGASAGYLLRESDGTLTFVGGGPAENADALREFLEKYGLDVEKWYAYGQDEADTGAMKQLINANEVSVGKTYVIEAKEITE